MWQVEYTDQFGEWFDGLSSQEQNKVEAAVDQLQEGGPGLGRPWVDTLTGTSLSNLKELRPRGGFLRILFAFDPRRTAILLVGGDKRDRWEDWYQEAVPQAERLYAVYLEELRAEGMIQ